jgi:hypothetical protein
MIERAAKDGVGVRTVRPATVILQPSGVIRVLVKVAVRNVVVLPADHTTQAREVAFNHVGVLAVAVAVGERMVDAARLISSLGANSRRLFFCNV